MLRIAAMLVVGVMILASFFSIKAAAGLPPVAIALPEYQDVYLGEYAYFDGNASYDPDGYIIGEENYTWWFGDDGFAIGRYANHTYETPGSYLVNLTVYDNSGMVGCDYSYVNVTGNLSAPAIAVEKIVDYASAYPGDILTYTISFNNTGMGSADYVWINDTLPAGVTYIGDSAASLPQFVSRNMAGNIFYYGFSNVPPGNYAFAMTVSIQSSVLDGTILSNHATCEFKPSGVFTEDWASTTVVGPSIALSKTVDKATAAAGDVLCYTLWFNNTGSGAAANASFNDTLPAGVTYISDTASDVAGATFVSRDINVGNLFFLFTSVMPGVHSFMILVQIDSGIANGTNLTNWAFCTYTTPNDYYSLPETSDYATTVITVAYPDLSISADDLTFSNPNPNKWDDLTIDADVHNVGAVSAVCTVSLYVNNVSEQSLIYREFEVFVPVGGSATVSAYWTANVDGNLTIFVDIADSDPSETNLANNLAYNFIYVSESCGELKVKASSDKQKYVGGVDDYADIAVKVTYLNIPIEGASVSAYVIAPDFTNTSVMINESSRGTYVGRYYFTNVSAPGTYRIVAIAIKAGYLNGQNHDSKSSSSIHQAQ